MNKAIAVLLLAAAVLPTYAETNDTLSAEAIIGESIKVFQAEGWTAQDVADAIKALRGLYVRDNATKDGRARWHGKVVETRVDTNALIRTTIHEDGAIFQDEAKIVTPAESVKASNERLPKPITTNGVPVKLAEARLRRQAEVAQGVSNVTVTITAGQK